MNQLTCALSVCCIDLPDLPSVLNLRGKRRLTMDSVVVVDSVVSGVRTHGRQLVALFGKASELWPCE